MVQKAILQFHGKNQETIIREIIHDLLHTCGNANGLHVVKKLIRLCLRPDYVRFQSGVIGMVAAQSIELAQNPYGNYALQIVLDSYSPASCAVIAESIKGKVAHLSLTKYSSNVVERCMERAAPRLRSELISELTQATNLICMRSRC